VGIAILKNLYKFILYKIVEAAIAMPVNPYENLTAVACLRTEAARKGRYGQSAGSVDTSQANVNGV